MDVNNYQIYYANLLPVDLKQILENGKDSKAKRPTKTITIKPIVESSPSSLKNICLNFIYNSKSQMGIPIKDIEEFEEKLKNEEQEKLIQIYPIKKKRKSKTLNVDFEKIRINRELNRVV